MRQFSLHNEAIGMIAGLCLMAALNSKIADPVEAAIARYRTIRSYEVTVRSSSTAGSQIIHYSYRKPGFIRMEFVEPHRGAVLIYSPDTRKARLRPFGISAFPSLTLDPDNPLIQGPGGQRVDHSDVGALLDNVKALQRRGTMRIIGRQELFGFQTLHVMVSGEPGATAANVARYELWFDTSNCMPVKVESRDARDELIETVVMDDFRIDIDFPERFFDP
jgi:outer membrane lipoprotein-sorting protein